MGRPPLWEGGKRATRPVPPQLRSLFYGPCCPLHSPSLQSDCHGALLSQGSGESRCNTKRQARGRLPWSSVTFSGLPQLLFGQKTNTNKHNNKTNQGDSGCFGVSGTTKDEAHSKALFPMQSVRPFQRPFPASSAKAQIKGLTNDSEG